MKIIFKKTRSAYIAIVCVFFLALGFLHQRIEVLIEVYQIDKNYTIYNELIDQRDTLVYNFSKKVTLANINHWVKENGFICSPKERVLALNIPVAHEEGSTTKVSKEISPLYKIFRFGTSAKAIAQQR